MNISDIVKLPKSPGVFLLFLLLLTFITSSTINNIESFKKFVHVEVSAKSRAIKRERTVVESTFKTFQQIQSPQNPTTYEEFLLAQNSKLEKLIEKTNERSRTIGIIHAAAGYGKTSLITTAIKKQSSARQIEVYTIVKDVLPNHNLQKAPDLILDGEVVNSLPTIDRAGILDFWQKILDKTSPDVLCLIDGLDEAHQSVAELLIDTAKEKRRNNELGNRDIIFLTRPEVVDQLIELDNAEVVLAGIEVVGLNPHRITRAVLELRVRNFLDYKASKETESNPDQPTVNGKVVGINDDATVNRVSSEVEIFINNKPYLAELLRTGFLTGLLLEHVRIPQQYSLGSNENMIKGNVFDRLLKRNEKSHSRPSQFGTKYKIALFEIAAHVSPDRDGKFSVPPILRAPHPSHPENDFSFEPADVLQRSGLVDMIPARGNELYRFEPVWLQSTLAAHSERMYQVYSWHRILVIIILVIITAYLAELIYSNLTRNKNHSDPQ